MPVIRYRTYLVEHSSMGRMAVPWNGEKAVANFQVERQEVARQDALSTMSTGCHMKTASKMTKTELNHRANTLNSNKKTAGTNDANAKMHGNRGKQLNPNGREQITSNRSGSTAPKRQGE